jgi:hypothetical protein
MFTLIKYVCGCPMHNRLSQLAWLERRGSRQDGRCSIPHCSVYFFCLSRDFAWCCSFWLVVAWFSLVLFACARFCMSCMIFSLAAVRFGSLSRDFRWCCSPALDFACRAWFFSLAVQILHVMRDFFGWAISSARAVSSDSRNITLVTLFLV